jgi:hypothetical protein
MARGRIPAWSINFPPIVSIARQTFQSCAIARADTILELTVNSWKKCNIIFTISEIKSIYCSVLYSLMSFWLCFKW